MNKQNLFLIIGIVGISSLILTGVLLFQGNKNSGTGSVVDQTKFSFKNAVGSKAPDFTLSDINGNNITLSRLLGKNVVLFFNEGLMCYPACLDQIVQLSKDNRLNNDNTVAFSIVVDSPSSWQKSEKDLPYLAGAKVLFDKDGKISQLYDTLKLPSSMHRGIYPGHTYFIIDKQGIIRYTFDDPYMGIRNDTVAGEIEKLK